jgi:hypothetical protein
LQNKKAPPKWMALEILNMIMDFKILRVNATQFQIKILRIESNAVFRACPGFWFEGENERKFIPMRRKNRSVAALHENFCNEIGMNFRHL